MYHTGPECVLYLNENSLSKQNFVFINQSPYRYHITKAVSSKNKPGPIDQNTFYYNGPDPIAFLGQDYPELNFVDECSILCWVNTKLCVPYARYIAKGNSSSDISYMLTLNQADCKTRFYLRNDLGVVTNVLSNNVLENNKWALIGGHIKDNNAWCSIGPGRDGIKQSFSSSLFQTTTSLKIFSNSMNASFGEIWLFNRCLSDIELSNIYNSTRHKYGV